MKQLFIKFYSIAIFYLSYIKQIPTIYSTIVFIILGTILLIRYWPVKFAPLFKIINNDDLNKFKEYISKNNLKVTNIHKFEYISGRTPILYAISQKAVNIFRYLLENGYNLNYFSRRGEPVITFVTHSGNIQMLNLLLQYKSKFDLYAKNPQFKANALEIAIWRGEDKKEEIEALLNAGMKFSINGYKNSRLEQSLPFNSISIDVKRILAKKYVLDKTVNQLNLVNEIDKKNSLKSFEGVNIYWKEYLDFA
jgi:ankyrin repeat protein